MFKAAFAASTESGVFSSEALTSIYLHLTSMEPSIEMDFNVDDIVETYVEVNKRDIEVMKGYQGEREGWFAEIAVLKDSILYGDCDT